MLTLTLTMCALPAATAHDPAWDIPTYAYITASPTPVGVNQPVTLVMWLNLVPPTAAGAAGDRWVDMTVEVTKPDNSKETLGPFNSDSVGSTYAIFTPDQVGTYTFVLNYPGQVLNGSAGTGIYNDRSLFGGVSPNLGDNYLPSTATTTLTVQEEQLPLPENFPLPTEYWSRPIDGQNTNWEAIASNWLAEPQIVGKVQPDGIAPNSAHIMWTRSIQDGGIVGGESTSTIDSVTFYDGTAYEGKFSVPIIMNGRLYYNLPKSDVSWLGYAGKGTTDGGYIAIDLRTGEQVWFQNYPGFDPEMGQLYDYESPNQHGVIPNGFLWAQEGTTWVAYDGLTGEWLFNLTDVPSGTQAYGPNGEILSYILDTNAHELKLWNNTAAHGLTGAWQTPNDTTSTNFNQWRPVGREINASDAYSWIVTIPDLPPGSAINKVIPGDLIIGSAGTASLFGAGGATYNVWAISIDPATRGQLLWSETYDAPEGNISRSFDAIDPVNRVFIMHDKETLQWTGYSMEDGSYLWGPTESEDAWNYYTWSSTVADGKLLTNGYGIVYCYDTLTGDIIWEFKASGGLDIPYAQYPMAVGAIADGKVYVGIIEHSANAPYWKGAKVYALDLDTGEEIWSIYSHSPSTFGGNGAITTGFAVADGYLTYLNLYSMQITCIGMGPSATTVTVGPKVSLSGSSVLIEGTVTDIAAGTTQHEQAARFPNGVPAVSDDCMSAWMEYVYMQKPKPADVTGVQIHLTAIDPNGNFQDIGYVTSDALGNFAVDWVPPVPGLYTVTATFEGSESYYGSTAGTSFVVSEASAAEPVETPTQTPAQTAAPTTGTPVQSVSPSPSEAPQPSVSAGTPTLTYIAITVAVIVIVAVAAALVLRRK
ncbi:MAG: PQQ-binding-like beta-propeller repeat protein [Candidatus Bathyarchaeota archaeon]|nr:PQQ-binding-like beta-propeller repeat protein [Candidatus Bathyarchaeota archaeon]